MNLQLPIKHHLPGICLTEIQIFHLRKKGGGGGVSGQEIYSLFIFYIKELTWLCTIFILTA